MGMGDIDGRRKSRRLGSGTSNNVASNDPTGWTNQTPRLAAESRALYEASVVFAEAGEEREQLTERLVYRVAVSLGDACVLRVLRGSHLEPVAAHHVEAAACDLLRTLLAEAPHAFRDAFSVRVLQSGRSILMTHVPTARLRLWTNVGYWRVLERQPIHSVLVVPVRVNRRVRGTIGAWRDRTEPGYSQDDRAFLETLARRIGIALARSS
jgi:GAF domain-containing protein